MIDFKQKEEIKIQSYPTNLFATNPLTFSLS